MYFNAAQSTFNILETLWEYELNERIEIINLYTVLIFNLHLQQSTALLFTKNYLKTVPKT